MQHPRRTRTHLLGALVLLSSMALAAASTVVDVRPAGRAPGAAAAAPWFVRFCVAQPTCNPSMAEAWSRQTQRVQPAHRFTVAAVPALQAREATSAVGAAPWFVRFCIAQPPCLPNEAWYLRTHRERTPWWVRWVSRLRRWLPWLPPPPLPLHTIPGSLTVLDLVRL